MVTTSYGAVGWSGATYGAGVTTSQSGLVIRQINGLFKVDVAPAVNPVSSRVGGVCYVGLFDMYIV